jgi:ligand-binding sensor domain-containing protein
MNLIKKCFFVAIIIFGLVIFSNFTIAQNKPEPPKPEPQVKRINGLKARFIVALISDGNGGAWIGTEDEGVFHCQSDNKILNSQQKTVSATITLTLSQLINLDDCGLDI